MKLQLALDDICFDDAIDLIGKVRDYVDIVELGTPLLIDRGMEPIRKLKALYPELEYLADAKIMDAGKIEARIAFEAGADYCTVLGVTGLRTIQGCLEEAETYGKKIFVDMICVEDAKKRVGELEAVGVTGISVHTGVDEQAAGLTPLESLKQIRACSQKSEISVAGGIKPETADAYIREGADILIVGGGIYRAADPVAAAKTLYEMVHKK